MRKFLRHLSTPRWIARFCFPASTMSRIKTAIVEGEERSGLMIVFAVESSFTMGQLLRRKNMSARASEIFSRMHVWDTEKNDGLLIYLNLAEREAALVADRGISETHLSKLSEIKSRMETGFADGNFERALTEAIGRLPARR